MEHKIVKTTVKVVSVNPNIIRGIMENGHFVAKRNDELVGLKEEEIASKVTIDLMFDKTIQKVSVIDGEAKDVDTKMMTIDLKKLVPRIADVHTKLAKCRASLYNTGILAGWLVNATIELEQTRYQQNEIIEDTNIVAERDLWTNKINSVTLEESIESEVDDCLAALQVKRKEMFLEEMMGKK